MGAIMANNMDSTADLHRQSERQSRMARTAQKPLMKGIHSERLSSPKSLTLKMEEFLRSRDSNLRDNPSKMLESTNSQTHRISYVSPL